MKGLDTIKRINYRHYLKIALPYLWILLLSVGLLFSIISRHEFWSGYDTYFHMNGIYESAMQIKTGHFSYFLSGFGFEKSGRIVNGLYGPFFNYLCGALLLLCHSWIRFEFTLFLITLVITGCGFYWCARAMKIRKPLATLLASFYMISHPILQSWLGNFEFIGLGAAVLLPFVVLAGIQIVQRRQIRVVPLAIVMAVCLQIHLITSLVAVVTLIPFMLGGLIRSPHRLRMIGRGCLAVLLTIGLSGNIFGTLYDVGTTNHLVTTWPKFNLQTTQGGKTVAISHGSFTVLGHLTSFLLILLIILIIWRIKRMRILEWCLAGDAFGFLLLSSHFFPWNRLMRIVPSLAYIIQFPSRFVAMIFLATLLLVGRLLMTCSIHWRQGIGVVLALLFIGEMSTTVRDNLAYRTKVWQSPQVVRYWVKRPRHLRLASAPQIRHALRSRNLSQGINVVHKITTDYLPTTRQFTFRRYYRLPLQPDYARVFQHQAGYHKTLRHHQLMISWRSSRRRTMRIPIVKYHATQLMLNHHRIRPRINLIGAPRVTARKGNNQLSAQYRPGRIFVLLSLICILSWLIVLARAGLN